MTESEINNLNTHNFFNLNIKKIIGTSAKNSQQFTIQDDLIAYTASGGVVVSTINTQNNEVLNQRFFCANISSNCDYNHDTCNSINNNSISSANAYLNMLRTENMEEIKRDLYGYPINSEPIAIYGTPSDSIDDSYCNGNSTSPSKMKDKVRSINCMAISPNKKLLAIGEIGYQPRILIFSLADNSSDNPIWAIYEHSFGIHSLAFSPDSRHLCSLGLINDGFINIWRMRKNAILGNLISGNFIDASILNDDELLVITNSNQLLLLKLSFDTPKLVTLKTPEFEFSSIVVDYYSEKVWFGSDNYRIESWPFVELVPGSVTSPVLVPSSSSAKLINGFTSASSLDGLVSRPILRIFNFSETQLIFLNDCEEIKFMNKESQDCKVIATSLLKNLSGLKYTHSDEFLAFSKNGCIKKLVDTSELKDLVEFPVISNDSFTNATTAVEKNGDTLILGDKYGTLSILKFTSNPGEYEVLYQTKAHSSTINEIIYFEYEKFQVICSISRDRMIQVFTMVENTWDLLQTLPIHNGNLLQIAQFQNQIYVCSSDRTISIHKLTIEDEDKKLRIYQEKIITLKSTPSCMKIFDKDLVVSTNDKSVLIYDVSNNFELKRTLRLVNEKINESLLVESFIKYRNLIIVWSSDKSLRAFQYSNGKEIGVAWGHSESILQLYLYQNHELISIGNDACLFSWEIVENLKASAGSVMSQAEDTTTIGNEVANLQQQQQQQQQQQPMAAPLYTKVTRKILPTLPVKSSADSKSNEKEKSSTNTTVPTPSVTPKLTAATLKRIEAKNNAGQGTNSGSRPTSPLRSTPSINNLSSSGSVKMASRAGVSTQKNHNLAKLQSPMKTPTVSTSPNRPSSPTRPITDTISTTTANKVRPRVLMSSSPTPPSRLISRREEKNMVDTAVSKLEDVMNILSKCQPHEKLVIRSKLEQALALVIDNRAEEEQKLLEKYSDQLVELVHKKLKIGDEQTNTIINDS
ncbi:Mitogen-activated protein kinase-binding protein 1 [Candida tropicalis]